MTQEEQKVVEEFTKMNLTKKALYHYNDMQDAFLIGLFKGEKMQLSLPSNLDEAAEESMPEAEGFLEVDIYGGSEAVYSREQMLVMYKAGAEWMAGQGWIDDGSMPPETKQESDTLQGHREWTESEPVLAWDSMYGCRVDWTRNGKWMSEQRGGYTGQVCHRIIAWRPIPEYKEKQ